MKFMQGREINQIAPKLIIYIPYTRHKECIHIVHFYNVLAHTQVCEVGVPFLENQVLGTSSGRPAPPPPRRPPLPRRRPNGPRTVIP